MWVEATIDIYLNKMHCSFWAGTQRVLVVAVVGRDAIYYRNLQRYLKFKKNLIHLVHHKGRQIFCMEYRCQATSL